MHLEQTIHNANAITLSLVQGESVRWTSFVVDGDDVSLEFSAFGDLPIKLPQIACNGDFMHRVGDFALFYPVTNGAPRIVAEPTTTWGWPCCTKGSSRRRWPIIMRR